MRLLPTLLAIVVAATTTLAAGVAVGQEPSPDASTGPEQAVLIVLDVSGSMEREGADGTVLLDAARAAVTDLVDSIPDSIPVGLRLYGHQAAQGAPTAEQCRDTELVLPIGEATPDRLPSVLDPLEPNGQTPIGATLEQSGSDVAGFDAATVILVSDGEADCSPPDPCDAADALAAGGVEVVVDTVGLLLDTDEAQAQLGCISEATGGTFVTADDTTSLTTALQESASRAQRRYEVSGEPIAGGSVPTEAPTMEPGVQYVDEVRGDELLFYELSGAGPGVTVDVEIVREADPDADGRVLSIFAAVVDRDDGRIGSTYIGSAEGVDQPDIIALRDRVVPDDVDGAFLRIEAQGSSPDILDRLQIRFVTDDLSSPSPEASPPVSASPSPAATTSPAPSTSATPAPVETVTVAADDTGAGGGVPAWLLVVVAVMALALVAMAAWIARLRRGATSPDGGSAAAPPPSPPT